MAGGSRMGLQLRLACLEHRAVKAPSQDRPGVVVYLPRKDNDPRPPGVYPMIPGVLTVLCAEGHPEPALPEGW